MAQPERFYFWRGYYDALSKLSDDTRRSRFVMALCAYAFDDEEPDFSDDAMLDFAWSLVADAARESVEIGRTNSANGRRGGRPSGRKKTPAKGGAKSGGKSAAKTPAESAAESVRYSNVSNVPDASRTSADAEALASADDVERWYLDNGVPMPMPASEDG